MRFDPSLSKEHYREGLTAEAEAAFGADRLPELQASIDGAANALWLLGQQPLDLTDAEPDFITGFGPSALPESR